MTERDVRAAVDAPEKGPGKVVADLGEDLGLGSLDGELETELDKALGDDLGLGAHTADDPGPNSDGDGADADAPGDGAEPPKTERTPSTGTDAAHNEAPDPRPPEYADDALALRFTEEHKDELRYVQGWGKWLLWDGQRWAFDDTLKAFDFSRAGLGDSERGFDPLCDREWRSRWPQPHGAAADRAQRHFGRRDRRLGAAVHLQKSSVDANDASVDPLDPADHAGEQKVRRPVP